jgi:hypothetical protein
VGKLLADDTMAPGEKFILFVTDGQPDFCDDGNELCPPDSVVGELQTLATGGIHTLVFGISSPLTTISDAVLQGFANAGASQPVAPLVADINQVFDQCSASPVGRRVRDHGKQATRGHTIGDYNPRAAARPRSTSPTSRTSRRSWPRSRRRSPASRAASSTSTTSRQDDQGRPVAARPRARRRHGDGHRARRHERLAHATRTPSSSSSARRATPGASREHDDRLQFPCEAIIVE